MESKKIQLKQLITDLSKDTRCENMLVGSRDVSLLNNFYQKEFLQNFPDVWFDWEYRANSELMIIGQDWGPFSAMCKIRNSFESTLAKNPTIERQIIWEQFINNPKDRTTKRIVSCLKESSVNKRVKLSPNFVDKVFFTVAVFFARQGIHFRGNENFAPTESARKCLDILDRQIQIVKPKVILTLGNLAFTSLAELAGYKPSGNLTHDINKVKNEGGVINYASAVVIPNFHPAAHIPKDLFMPQYEKIWDFIKNL